MAVVALLGPKPGECVLDLCAAPGGKTTHIASCLEGRGLLVSNEIHPARAKILSQNVERMGIGNAVVTNEDSGTLASFFPEFFDCMVVDAPCSGEGMFRKDEQARNEWSEANVKLCAERQQEILDNAAEMLKPGGRMVYSTCTFAPEEDEAGISDFLKRHPEFSVVRLEPGGYPEGLSCGHPEWSQDQNTDLKYTFRIWPHESEGEGHYLALLKKDGTWAPEDSRKRKQPKYWNDKAGRAYLGEFFEKSLTEEGYALLKDGMDQLILFGDQLYMLPDGMPALDRLRVLRPGLHLGEFKTKRFEPSHALSHFLKPQHAVSVCRLDPEDPQVLDYLKGNTVRGEAGLSGWTLVCIGKYLLDGKGSFRCGKKSLSKGFAYRVRSLMCEALYMIGIASYHIKRSARMRTRRKGRWLLKQRASSRECAKAHSFFVSWKTDALPMCCLVMGSERFNNCDHIFFVQLFIVHKVSGFRNVMFQDR